MRVALRKDELVPLDRDQIAFLDMIDDNRRMLVLGGPGTGKTLLAREMHARLTAAGRRTLVLCWTRALAAALRDLDEVALGVGARGVEGQQVAHLEGLPDIPLHVKRDVIGEPLPGREAPVPRGTPERALPHAGEVAQH
jgi:Flp pilus assembly CpaF family ATPase